MLNYFVNPFICDVAFIKVNAYMVKFILMPNLAKFFLASY